MLKYLGHYYIPPYAQKACKELNQETVKKRKETRQTVVFCQELNRSVGGIDFLILL